ncbi:TIGR04255 family protein [Rhodocaloribacter litoris]|uniref:TIGR04255 family protein n=1 Tax=Rhodocaloribacter litoris TaxID=2558931 RepID=UPI00141F54E3|nr:TIGR04255 family protein [Rhodocaloribacter litoris]QXD13982.1 TIGR04255 family protein [Rhodocaloribacter litoris]
MAEPRHLARAPIVEAVIELRVKLPAAFQVEEFLSLQEVLAERYPEVKKVRRFEHSFGVIGGKPFMEEKDEGFQACRFQSSDGRNVAQFRRDGFSFSRLKPYTRWEAIYAEAMDLWELYKTKASPEVVTRIAVRYINHVEIPLFVELSDYLTTMTLVPEQLPQEVTEFLNSMVVYDKESRASARITQALGPEVTPGRRLIILDIDAFKRVELEADSPDIPDILEQLRQLKNRIFFGIITEKTASLYE